MSEFLNHEKAYRGESYLNKIDEAPNILICGCGTLGSNLADNLARHGVKNLSLLDMDRVEEHNVANQVYNNDDVGMRKIDALENHLWSINDFVGTTFGAELTDRNKKKVLRDVGLIVDCFDNRKSRLLLKDTGIDCVHAGLYDGYGEVFWDKDYTVPQEVSAEEDVCDYPLARNIAVLTTTVLSEEILDYIISDKPRFKNWTITLKDLQIRESNVTT